MKVQIKEFAYNNPSGGTMLSNASMDPVFPHPVAVAEVISGFYDYEVGYRFIGLAGDAATRRQQLSGMRTAAPPTGASSFANSISWTKRFSVRLFPGSFRTAPVRNKSFSFLLNGTPMLVEAEQEGNARYMVRLSIPKRMGRVRIGYLTGTKRTWLAEFFGQTPRSVPATSAKAACRSLAEWAIRQPAVAPFATR